MLAKTVVQIRQAIRDPHIIRQLMKYFVTGGSTVGADYGTFVLLLAVLKAPLVVATTGSLIAGFVVSFTLNRIWVFGAHKEKAHKTVKLQIVLYTALFLFNTGFTYLFIKSLVDTGMNAYVAKLFSILIIMVWNFVVYKKVIFRLR